MKVIICGAGQVGENIARYLAKFNTHTTIIDTSPELVAKISDSIDVQGVVGFASHPDVLEKAGAQDADLLIAVTHIDEVNMIACEVVHALFNVNTKIARIRNQSYLMTKWRELFSDKNLSIDFVISPEVEVARAISHNLTIHGASVVLPHAQGLVKIIGVKATQQTPVVNTPINHIVDLFPDIDFKIIGLIREDKFIIPESSEVILPDDELYICAADAEIVGVIEAFGVSSAKPNYVLILGGGNVGLALAQEITKNHPKLKFKIIERNTARAQFIARQLPAGSVVNGDALDSDILSEAGVYGVETVVSVTEDDRVNSLAGLLAKRHGAFQALSLINKRSYIPLITSLGIDVVINPRNITVSKILQHIRKGGVRSVHSIKEGFAEMLEIEAHEGMSLINKRVQDIDSKGEIIVAAIVRNNSVILPKEDERVEVDDLVIVMSTTDAISKVEKMFAEQVEYF